MEGCKWCCLDTKLLSLCYKEDSYDEPHTYDEVYSYELSSLNFFKLARIFSDSSQLFPEIQHNLWQLKLFTREVGVYCNRISPFNKVILLLYDEPRWIVKGGPNSEYTNEVHLQPSARLLWMNF